MNHFKTIAVACVAIAGFSALVAQAEPLLNGKRIVNETAAGGLSARAAGSIQSSTLDAAGQRRVFGDGQGNVAGTRSGAFTTAGGAEGARSLRFKRSDDGSVNASSQGSVNGANGSADRSASYTRNADGSASGERSTTATNANTGVTLDASTTYTKGSGFSRSASCKDAAGNTVTCGSAR